MTPPVKRVTLLQTGHRKVPCVCGGASRLHIPDGIRNLAQAVTSVDYWYYLPGLYEIADGIQVLLVQFGHHRAKFLGYKPGQYECLYWPRQGTDPIAGIRTTAAD